MPKVAIIILNWNSLKDTLECLESCSKIDYPNFEVIVVDNASTDGSVERIKEKFPEAVLVQNPRNLGYAEGNNVGMKFALGRGADYVWLLNSDTVVAPDSLKMLVEEMLQIPSPGLVSPVIYCYDDRKKIQFCGSSFSWENNTVHNFKNLDELSLSQGVDMALWGTALLTSRLAIEKIGFFDKKFFAYWEDMDFSARSLMAGYKNIVVPAAKIYHKYHNVDNGSMRKMPAHYCFYMARNEFWFWEKNIRGFRKRQCFVAQYLAKIAQRAAYLAREGYCDKADACFQGFLWALRKKGGAWDSNVLKVPRWIQNFLMKYAYFFGKVASGISQLFFIRSQANSY